MAQNLSYRYARNVVKVLYEHEGFLLYDKTPGENVTEEFGQEIKDCKLGALFAFIDELIVIIRYQNYYLTACVAEKDNEHCLTYLRFCTGMLSTLSAIRALSGMGHDLGARTLLRYYYELSMLWSRIQLDEDARNKFELKDIESTNRYWHAFMAKRRTEKFLFNGAASGNFSWIGSTAEDHLNDIYNKLSLSGHPGFWGLYFNLSNDFSSVKDNIIGKNPDNASIFTLSAALLLTTLPFGINGITKWDFKSPPLFDTTKIHPSHSKGIDWTEYCHELRKMILGIFLFSTKFSTELSGGKW